MAVQQTSPMVTVCRHALVQHALCQLRQLETPAALFRQALHQVVQGLLWEATASLPLKPVPITTPVAQCEQARLCPDTTVWIVPILRAGLSFQDAALAWLPEARLYHVGVRRNETTLQPEPYYCNLPEHPANPQLAVFLVDPMLATGGSARYAVQLLTERGVPESCIQLVCAIAAPEGLAHLATHCPQVRVTTAAVDECLNERGYIVPGLGDAGDRYFGTV